MIVLWYVTVSSQICHVIEMILLRILTNELQSQYMIQDESNSNHKSEDRMCHKSLSITVYSKEKTRN